MAEDRGAASRLRSSSIVRRWGEGAPMSQLCPRCQRTLDLPGQVAFCPYCGHSLSVTTADTPRTTPPSAIPPAESVPERLGDYRLLRRLGQGGMGVVYEGEHLPTGRRVAVKLVDVEASD